MSEESVHNVEQDESSSQTASQILWSTGTLSSPIPNGFYSVIPEKKLKELFKTIPSPDELHSIGMCGLKADIILVDAEKDKKLSMLKQLTAALVKGLNSNPASLIKKIAGLVTDFYKRPNSELSHANTSAEEISHLIEDRSVQLLGQIKNGSCRPRAILFKVLADAVGLETKIVVGLPSNGVVEYMDSCRHMSVITVLNSVELLIDLMRFPGQLIPFADKAVFMSHISATEEDSAAEYDSCDSPLEPNSPLFGFTDRTNSECSEKNEIFQSLYQRKIDTPSNIFIHSPRHVMFRSSSSNERNLSSPRSVPNIANAFWRGKEKLQGNSNRLQALGFFGEVFRGIWHGTDVAIKVFLEQDLTVENMEDFCNEVLILSRLRHPNGIDLVYDLHTMHVLILYNPNDDSMF